MTTTSPSRKLFVNLSVRDLPRSMEFFTRLGFTFDPHFTDASATCMLIGQDASVMLLVETRFKDFMKKEICDTRTHTEGLFCVMVDSRAEVDQMVNTAITAGATPAMPVQDLGFMYSWSFYDLDGHHWEVGYLDLSACPQ